MSDVDMESVGLCEYDLDDLDPEETPARISNATVDRDSTCSPALRSQQLRISKSLVVETWTRTELAVG